MMLHGDFLHLPYNNEERKEGKKKKKKKELIITDYDTVKGENLKEMSLNSFLNTLDRNIKSPLYDVDFDEENKRFNIIYDGKSYILKLDEYIISRYELGKYDSLTIRLKQLVDKQENVDRSEEVVEKRTKHYEDMIKIAESGKIPNDEVRLAYINHLKKNKRFNLDKIKEYFKNIKNDISTSKNETSDNLDHIWPFNNHDFETINYCMMIPAAVLFIGSLITSVITLNFLWMLTILLPFTIDLVPVPIYLFHQIKNRIKRLSNTISNRKLLNSKIKSLEKMKTDDHFKSTNERRLDELVSRLGVEEIIEEPNQILITNQIVNDIEFLAKQLKKSNSSDAKKLLIKLREIVIYYQQKTKNIDNDKNQGLSVIGRENEINMEVRVALNNITMEANSILAKEIEQNQLDREVNQVVQVIDSSIGYNEQGKAYQKKK